VARLGWSPEAQRDLRDIYAWIARDSSRYAAATVQRIRRTVQQLRRFPESGRTIPEVPGGPYREILVGQYRVLYRYDRSADVVVIIGVIHGKQRLPSFSNGS
jgi:toxin ParE1/3/4